MKKRYLAIMVTCFAVLLTLFEVTAQLVNLKLHEHSMEEYTKIQNQLDLLKEINTAITDIRDDQIFHHMSQMEYLQKCTPIQLGIVPLRKPPKWAK